MTDSYHLILPMPAGRKMGAPNVGLLSVMFVPRLQGLGRLADWTRDWRNWPRVINGTAPGPTPGGAPAPALKLSVGLQPPPPPVAPFSFAANSAISVGSAKWVSPAPSQAAWSAVFGTGPSSIPVNRFRPVLRSSDNVAPMYDAGQVATWLRDFYRQMATDHTSSPPGASDLASNSGYNALLGSGELDAYEEYMEPLGDGDVTGEATPERADFHQALAYLGAHPELLRLLGVVVDLEVDIPPASAGAFRLVVESSYDTDFVPGKTVPVVVQVAPDFWPEATSGEGPGRWASIGDASHRVASLDIHAGIAAVSGLAGTPDDPDGSAPAQPPSPGLYVTRLPGDVLTELNQRWAAQNDLEDRIRGYLGFNTPTQVLADGDLLVAGRRYDVFDQDADGGAGRWFSLWERIAPAGVAFLRDNALSFVPAPDEGWMTTTAFTEMPRALTDGPGDPDPDPDPNPNPNPDGPRPGRPYRIAVASPQLDGTVLRVNPVLFSWTGWSLVADPPVGGFSGVTGPTDASKRNIPTAATPVQVVIDYDVPDGVLPRLRYGHRYKFRARTVDLAGNSLPVGDNNPGGTTETPLVPFGRTSPLGAPVPMRREARPIPGWGDTTTTMVIKSELLQPDATVAPTSRLFFPPQTDQFHCELHGYPRPVDALFDDQATFDMFVARTATSIDVHAQPEPVTGELLSNPAGAWRTDVDYLGEPGANGFAFADLPASSGPVVSEFATAWPQSHAIGFEIRAGNAAPTVVAPTASGATVTAYVPKGVTRTVRVSIAGRADLADHWAMLQNRLPALFAQLRNSFVNGQHWMLSVPQPVKIVHAVRRPLAIPSIQPGVTVTRALGSTTAALVGTFALDQKSTGSVEVTGRWSDPVGGASPRTTGRLLFTQQVPYAETTTTSITNSSFDVGDTKRHDDVALSVVAFSRYARYFTERSTVRFTTPNQSVALYSQLVGNDGIDPDNVVVTVGGIVATAGRDYAADAAAGRIQRVGTMIPLDTDVEVDFIRLPITRRSDEAGAAPVLVTIPNSAVPDALLVEEVLPAFQRRTFDEGDTYGVFHEGQAVRVWLRGPWFTTGNGELLGVLVGEREDGPLNEVARDALSPLGPSGPVTVDDFPNAVDTRATLPGHPGVGVAGHEVRFDADRNLWFADVAISADLGYRSFIKLAFVRYQPVSIARAFIGEPVITEPIRLGATRQAQITRVGTDVEIYVNGYELGNRMTAQFQYADPDISDPDLCWVDIGAPTVLTKTPPGSLSDLVEWRATLPLPVDSRPVRVVVEDAERLVQQTTTGSQLVDSIAYVETIAVPTGWSAPPASTPGAPQSVTATPQHQAANVSWSEPLDDGGSPVTSYTVQRRTGTDAWGDPVEVSAPTTSLLVTGLTNGVRYGFRVRATNVAGSGPWSTRADATPAPSAPAQIDTVQALSGHRTALVRWDPPIDNGSPITGYRVERRQGTGPWGNGVDLSATQTRHIARGLSNGVGYEFRVRSSSSLGDGPWSAPVPVTPDAMRPAKVRNVVGLPAGIGTATVRWRPAAERGSAILRYRVQRRPVGTPTWGTPVDVGAAETSVEITGLAAGSSWEFRVRAENAIGNGDWSSPAAVTISSTVALPGQVTGVVLAPGNATLTVTWSEPADGGSAIIEYELQRKPSSSMLWPAIGTVLVPGDQLVHTYTGLVNGTSYDVRVRAVNAVGEGTWSVAATGSPTP